MSGPLVGSRATDGGRPLARELAPGPGRLAASNAVRLAETRFQVA